MINNINHQMALAIGYLREYVKWLEPKPSIRTYILSVPLPCIFPTALLIFNVFYSHCLRFLPPAIPTEVCTPAHPPYHITCSAYLLSVVRYKLSNPSDSYSPWTYSYSFHAPNPCPSFFTIQHNISWKKISSLSYTHDFISSCSLIIITNALSTIV